MVGFEALLWQSLDITTSPPQYTTLKAKDIPFIAGQNRSGDGIWREVGVFSIDFLKFTSDIVAILKRWIIRRICRAAPDFAQVC